VTASAPTERGKALYKLRGQLIEPVFGHTEHNRGSDRFSRRGRSAARTEWRLIATTHNLVKLHQHHTAAVTPTAAAGRPRHATRPNEHNTDPFARQPQACVLIGRSRRSYCQQKMA
jgi:hypothetical protein